MRNNQLAFLILQSLKEINDPHDIINQLSKQHDNATRKRTNSVQRISSQQS